ncbi:hypothetical protein FA10DRAFT_283596 [Acaromyces ingoldii]|uniref:Ricin B lectin domain-containing protein n=1 Tax=Acaromyces ingoldii TaxID=215250 RepID=A0A316Z1C9_9BASI|nr:hypothetical protein FA10DRAFT_283596 [Acaromyces ingoldii]PWN93985.1 hypothetical protein FA10DRAFT_283596 [Acaromyces ingoldii]
MQLIPIATILTAAAAAVSAAPAAEPATSSSSHGQVKCYQPLSGGILYASGEPLKPLSTVGDSNLLKEQGIKQSFTLYNCTAPGYQAPRYRSYGLLKPTGDGPQGDNCLGAVSSASTSRVRLQKCAKYPGQALDNQWFESGDDNLQLTGKPSGPYGNATARASLKFTGEIVEVTNEDYGQLPQFLVEDN